MNETRDVLDSPVVEYLRTRTPNMPRGGRRQHAQIGDFFTVQFLDALYEVVVEMNDELGREALKGIVDIKFDDFMELVRVIPDDEPWSVLAPVASPFDSAPSARTAVLARCLHGALP